MKANSKQVNKNANANADDFLIDNTIWKVILSNNKVVISDNDYHDGKSDWERLREYVQKNNLFIKHMEISFRDHKIKIPDGNYYYFRRMALSRFGKINRQLPTYQYFIVGSTNDNTQVDVIHYLIPELQKVREETRYLDNNEISLI